MTKPISLIIPTFNNFEYLLPCLQSIADNTVEYYKYNIVNNGSEELKNYLGGDINITHTGRNLGWAGGITEGIKNIKEDSDYILLMNDDTLILPHDYDWLSKMRNILDQDETVAAVGPSSNVVMGNQNFLARGLPAVFETKFLIGFCVLMRRKLFEEIGGMDESLPGGDDLDWSIRFRKAGYKLIVNRKAFVYHYGFKTGNRVHGDHTLQGGWNSNQMTEQTNNALIRKHGFKAWLDTIRNAPVMYDIVAPEYGDNNPFMGIVKGKGIDVGCGASKITPETIGVDITAPGEITHQGAVCAADIKSSGDNMPMFADGELDYVIARHNLEHYSNPIKTLREWNRVLKVGGKVGISVPDDSRLSSLRLDTTHKHSFDRSMLKDMLELTGFKVTSLGGTENQWNCFAIGEKAGNPK